MIEFKLSAKLKDTLSGFEGCATARLETIDGCVQYHIQPPVDKDGKKPDGEYIDWQRLEQVAEPTIDVIKPISPFNLGDKLHDKASGFEGVSITEVFYVNGCIRYGLAKQITKKDSKVQDFYFSSKTLELVKAKIVEVESTYTGCDADPSGSYDL